MKKDVLQKTCDRHIFQVSRDTYGKSYDDHLLDQYNRFIESVWFIGNLKQKVNSYFLSVNTILLATIGISFSGFTNVAININLFQNGAWHIAIPAIGLVLCIVWGIIIYSYKQKQHIKLAILHCIEEHLPIAPYMTEEEIIEEQFTGWKSYLFRVSLGVPWIFVLLYLVILVFV